MPLEVVILGLAVDGTARGDPEFHGFALAERLSKGDNAAIGYGPLYRTLGRMERAGLLRSRWEDADEAMAAGRPRRRLYRVTAEGRKALSRARTSDPLLRHLRQILGEG